MAGSERNFHHPYKPYDIQSDLMNAIYDCINENSIGIFESPTGTGKSLSLICSALTWLRDFQEKAFNAQQTPVDESDEPGWVREYMRQDLQRAAIDQRSELEARLKRIRAKELRQKQRYEKGDPVPKRLKFVKDEVTEPDDEAHFELENYDSEDGGKSIGPVTQIADPAISSASLELMQKLGLAYQPAPKDDTPTIDEIKILYCSRTHSQLTQFVQEIRRVDLPSASWVANDGPTALKDLALVKHLPMGSRRNLCINPKVSELVDTPAINERCLELQQPDMPKDLKCTFLPTRENETIVNDFRDHTLAAIRDIEDLGNLGKKLSICPYYASRATIKPSEIVTLPYPLLLQKSAREALDLPTKDHVIIIDEAHNLMDTISSIHSVSVTHVQLKRCRAQLGLYLQKFRNRLKGKNRVYVAQLVRVVDSISAYLDNQATHNFTDGLVGVSDLMTGKGADQINLYKLMHYLKQSKLARKVEGYVRHEEQLTPRDQHKGSTKSRPLVMPALTHIQLFLQALTNPAEEGRFFCEKSDNGDLSVKYMLLDPTHHFKEIVEDARAVILAGGTMSPMDDYARHLFPYVHPDRLKTWSCGHIIPRENLLAVPVSAGPNDVEFDFTFAKRNSPQMMETLGNCLVELAACIPDGLVVFFPSYAYLDQVVAYWKSKSRNSNAASMAVWDRLLRCKPIFQESKATSSTDTLLTDYTLSISSNKSGLLFSVIGGKLSEGINFSDALGRGVVVVGLPFPNIQSAQWKAKLEYIEQSAAKRTGSAQQGKEASREFYENACMRAVNQSIGRAIRHKGDYASILLLDRRYRGERIQAKLPGWIRQGIVKDEGGGFGVVVNRLRGFFDGKKNAV